MRIAMAIFGTVVTAACGFAAVYQATWKRVLFALSGAGISGAIIYAAWI